MTTLPRDVRQKAFHDLLATRIAVLDGAMGTMVRDWPCLLYLHLLPSKLRVALLKQTFCFNLEKIYPKYLNIFFFFKMYFNETNH